MRTRTDKASHWLLIVISLISAGCYFWDRRASEMEREVFTLAAKTAHAGVWVWRVKDNRLTWDKGMFELYEKSPEEFQGTYADFEQAVLPEDRPVVNALIQRCLHLGEPFSCAFRIVLPGGRLRYIHASGARSDDGQWLAGVNLEDSILKVYESNRAIP